MKLVAWICTVLALLGIGAGGGVAWQASHQSAALDAARGDLLACQGTVSDQALAIGNFRQRATDEAAHLATARDIAAAALSQRDLLAQKLNDQTTAREAATKKVIHETSDCQTLAAMPVCAAVAQRLWGEAPAADAHPAH